MASAFSWKLGPQASCTRMIRTILESKPHLAVSACRRAEQDDYTILKLLGELITHHIPVDMDALYGSRAYPATMAPKHLTSTKAWPSHQMCLKVSSFRLGDCTGQTEPPRPNRPADQQPARPPALPSAASIDQLQVKPDSAQPATGDTFSEEYQPAEAVKEAIDTLTAASEATAAAHREYLEFSNGLTRSMTRAIELQSRILQEYMQSAPQKPVTLETQPRVKPDQPLPAFTRDMCMEFAIGSVGKVLGPEFEVIDTYKARVRLPGRTADACRPDHVNRRSQRLPKSGKNHYGTRC